MGLKPSLVRLVSTREPPETRPSVQIQGTAHFFISRGKSKGGEKKKKKKKKKSRNLREDPFLERREKAEGGGRLCFVCVLPAAACSRLGSLEIPQLSPPVLTIPSSSSRSRSLFLPSLSHSPFQSLLRFYRLRYFEFYYFFVYLPLFFSSFS